MIMHALALSSGLPKQTVARKKRPMNELTMIGHNSLIWRFQC